MEGWISFRHGHREVGSYCWAELFQDLDKCLRRKRRPAADTGGRKADPGRLDGERGRSIPPPGLELGTRVQSVLEPDCRTGIWWQRSRYHHGADLCACLADRHASE